MNVVAFGAHPDDLEIGMGGTIARHASAGDRVVMVTATIPNNRETRRREAERAADVLGAELIVLDIPPEELLHSRDIVKRFDKVLETVNPDVIYTHWNSDSHQDHNAVSMATIGATRANRCAVLMYEQTIPGGIVPWGFRAQSYVDISAWMPMKMESIATHKSQVRANGDLWVQGVRGRAMYRGLPDERRVRRGLRGHQGHRRLLQGLEATAPRPRPGRGLAATLQTLTTSPDTPRTMFDKIRRLTGHVLVYGFGNIGNRVVGFLLIPVYSRYLTPEDYGVLALVAMLGQILYTIMNMGQRLGPLPDLLPPRRRRGRARGWSPPRSGSS